MDSLNYSNLGNKLNKKVEKDLSRSEALTLNEIIGELESESMSYIDEKMINHSYAIELEAILKLTSIEQTIKEINAVDAKVTKIKKISPIDFEVPLLDKFWKSLSKTMLLSLWNSLENEDETQEIIKGWYESLRIAIESELYSIQEKWV